MGARHHPVIETSVSPMSGAHGASSDRSQDETSGLLLGSPTTNATQTMVATPPANCDVPSQGIGRSALLHSTPGPFPALPSTPALCYAQLLDGAVPFRKQAYLFSSFTKFILFFFSQQVAITGPSKQRKPGLQGMFCDLFLLLSHTESLTV